MNTFLQMLERHMRGQEVPYRNIILRTFQEIERTPELKRRYDLVCSQYLSGRRYVNPRIAREIKTRNRLTTNGIRCKVTNETRLIQSYSELRQS